MATVYVSAGVYVQETDNSLYTPASAPTFVGIVGTATKGPVNEAVLITNEGQLIDTFGRPRSKDFGMQAAIEILKDCRTMYFVRIAGAAASLGLISVNDAGSGATPASIGPSANGEPFNLEPGATWTMTVTGVGAGTATFLATAAARECTNAETYNLNAIAGGGATTLTVKIDLELVAQTITFAAGNPLITNYAAVTAEEVCDVINSQLVGGSAVVSTGHTKATIKSDTRGLASWVQVTGGTANAAVNGFDFAITAIQGTGNVLDIDAVLGSEVASILTAAFGAGFIDVDVGVTGAVTVHTDATGVAQSILISSASTAIGAAPLVNITPLDIAVLGTNSTAPAATVRFSAATYGSHSSDIKVTVEASASLAGCVKLTVKYRDIVVETFDKLYKSPTPVTGGYEMVTTLNSGSTDGAYSASEWITATSLNPTGENPAVGTYTLSAGLDGDNWTSGTVVGTTSGTVSTGMQIYRNPERIDVSILLTPGISYAAVIAEGLDIAETRADCLYVADCPFNLSAQEVTKWHNGDATIGAVIVDQESRTETNSTTFNSSYGALYYPYVQMFDKYNDDNIWLPPCGVVARSMVYTDEVADTWFAPAGPNRSQTTSVLDIEYSATQGERDLMQQSGNNVNPLANLAGVGITIMGQKTLQRAPTALDRVNVRRLLLYLEKAVARSVKFLMFEQNDSIMWRRFINLVSPLLDDVKSRRGLYDYRVVADSSTTTDYMIDNNTFIGKIFLKPTKSAEILIVGFNLLPTGANFSEFVQS
jgi:hypothetical protein